jgi:hypothetical protein
MVQGSVNPSSPSLSTFSHAKPRVSKRNAGSSCTTAVWKRKVPVAKDLTYAVPDSSGGGEKRSQKKRMGTARQGAVSGKKVKLSPAGTQTKWAEAG